MSANESYSRFQASRLLNRKCFSTLKEFFPWEERFAKCQKAKLKKFRLEGKRRENWEEKGFFFSRWVRKTVAPYFFFSPSFSVDYWPPLFFTFMAWPSPKGSGSRRRSSNCVCKSFFLFFYSRLALHGHSGGLAGDYLVANNKTFKGSGDTMTKGAWSSK